MRNYVLIYLYPGVPGSIKVRLKMSLVNDSLILIPEISDRFIFGWTDYTLFAMILTVSVLIGIYFGFFSKQDTTMDYLLGGKRMGFFPIAMSLIAR